MNLRSLLTLALGLCSFADAGRQPVIRDYSTIEISKIRLAYNGPNGMTVSWSSNDQTNSPTVRYGLSADKLDQTANGLSRTFKTSTTYDNHVPISNLKPSTTYYYKIGGMSDSDAPLEFKTARPTSDKSEFSIGLLADLGLVVGNLFDKEIPATFDSLYQHADDVDFFWHSGDFAYSDDWLWEELEGVYDFWKGLKAYVNIQNTFYDELSNATKYKPYLVGPGNHEASCIEPDPLTISICPDGQRNFSAYQSHFYMPTADQTDGALQNFWYSWNYGQVHFVQFNTETDLGEGVVGPDEAGGSGFLHAGPFGAPNQQIEWLKADLAAVDRSVTPWVIVAGHRPWYTSDSKCGNCQDAFEDILYDNNVDLAWFGHVHYYERLAPTYQGEVDSNGLNNPRAPWYLVNGGAGNFEGHSTTATMEEYSELINEDDYGWCKLTIHNSTHLTVDFISSETNAVLDSNTLYKQH